MSVVMKQMVAPEYVQTMMEALFVIVIMAFYWTVME